MALFKHEHKKDHYTLFLEPHDLVIETNIKHIKNYLRVRIKTHHKSFYTHCIPYEKNLKNPKRGVATWAHSEKLEIEVVLKHIDDNVYQDQVWAFFIEEETAPQKYSILATTNFKISSYGNEEIGNEIQVILKFDIFKVDLVLATFNFSITFFEFVEDHHKFHLPHLFHHHKKAPDIADRNKRIKDVLDVAKEMELLNDNFNPSVSYTASNINGMQLCNEKVSEAILLWAQDTVEDYRGIKVKNLTSSWRNGMAFCSIIHKYRPDLIDYSSLSPNEIKENCKKAFDVANSLGIPHLIEPEDMIKPGGVDELTIVTFLVKLYEILTEKDRYTLTQDASDVIETVYFVNYAEQNNQESEENISERSSYFERQIQLLQNSGSFELPTYFQTGKNEYFETKSKYSSIAGSRLANSMELRQLHNIDSDDTEDESNSKATTAQRKPTLKYFAPIKKLLPHLYEEDDEVADFDEVRCDIDPNKPYYETEINEIQIELKDLDKETKMIKEVLKGIGEIKDYDTKQGNVKQQYEMEQINNLRKIIEKKSYLVHKQMRLLNLEKDKILDYKFNCISKKLNAVSQLEEWKKTDKDREKEEHLNSCLVTVINKKKALREQFLMTEDILKEDRLDYNWQRITSNPFFPTPVPVEQEKSSCKLL